MARKKKIIRQRRILGFDVSSDPQLLAALERAVQSEDDCTLSRWIRGAVRAELRRQGYWQIQA